MTTALKGRNVHRQTSDLLVCPTCRSSYLRPRVTWSGERLSPDVEERIEAWLGSNDRIDMVLVVGTERTPYLHDALLKGANVAWVNIIERHIENTGDGDWVVDGDPSKTVPYVIDSALVGVP